MVRNATVATAAPGTAREPDRRESRRDAARRRSAHQRASGGEDPRDDDRRRDREETGQQEEQQRRALPARKPILVRGAAEKRDTGHERARGSRRGRAAPSVRLPAASETVIHTSAAAATAVAAASPSPRGERTLCGARRRPARQRARPRARDGDPDEPAAEDSRDRDAGALDAAEEPQLPAPCAGPREPAPCRLEIAPHPARGEDREGEQERRAFATDEEEAVPRDVRRALRCAQLLDRSVDVEGRTALRARPARAPSARARSSMFHRRGLPGFTGQTQAYVRYVRASAGDGRQRGTPLRDDERRRRGPVILRAD